MSRNRKNARRTVAAFLLAAAMTASGATPSMAAGLYESHSSENRRSVAAAVAYWRLPLGGGRTEGPQAGLGLRYRYSRGLPLTMAGAGAGADALDLRLIGRGEPTLYLLHRPVTGRQRSSSSLRDGGTRTALIAGAAVVGGFLLYQVLSEDDEAYCLDPNNPACKIPSK